MDTSRMNSSDVKFNLFHAKVSRYLHASGSTLDLGKSGKQKMIVFRDLVNRPRSLSRRAVARPDKIWILPAHMKRTQHILMVILTSVQSILPMLNIHCTHSDHKTTQKFQTSANEWMTGVLVPHASSLYVAALPGLKGAVIKLLLNRDTFGFQNLGGLELQARSKCGNVRVVSRICQLTHVPLHDICYLTFGTWCVTGHYLMWRVLCPTASWKHLLCVPFNLSKVRSVTASKMSVW